MLRRMSFAMAVVLFAAIWVLTTTASAQKQPTPKPPDKQTLAADEVRQLLLMMDTDKNGKISKHEWMSFMEAEFERLDKDKSGELDITELTQSRVRARRFSSVGK